MVFQCLLCEAVLVPIVMKSITTAKCLVLYIAYLISEERVLISGCSQWNGLQSYFCIICRDIGFHTGGTKPCSVKEEANNEINFHVRNVISHDVINFGFPLNDSISSSNETQKPRTLVITNLCIIHAQIYVYFGT